MIELLGALLDEALELLGVNRFGRGVELVAGWPGQDQAIAGDRLQRLAQVRDVDLDGVGRGARWLLAPQEVDQAIGGDDLPDVQQEDRQHSALLGRTEVDDRPAGPRLERAEESKLHWASFAGFEIMDRCALRPL